MSDVDFHWKSYICSTLSFIHLAVVELLITCSVSTLDGCSEHPGCPAHVCPADTSVGPFADSQRSQTRQPPALRAVLFKNLPKSQFLHTNLTFFEFS